MRNRARPAIVLVALNVLLSAGSPTAFYPRFMRDSSDRRPAIPAVAAAPMPPAPVRASASEGGAGPALATGRLLQSPSLAAAQVMTLYPGLDTSVTEGAPNARHDADSVVQVALDAAGHESRALLYFSLAALPAGSAIHSARLQLHLASFDKGQQPATVRAYRILGSWDKLTTWNTRPAISGTQSASAVVSATLRFYEWNLTTLVGNWVNQPMAYPNRGVMLLSTSAVPFTRTFNSADAGSAALRPRLVVDFTAPPDPCATVTPLAPTIPNIWVFLMNFDLIQANGNPAGCLLFYRNPGPVATRRIPVTTCYTAGSVAYEGGWATFTGGHVRCELDLQQTLIDNGIQISLSQTYTYFEVLGAGKLNGAGVPGGQFANPVAVYAPDESACHDVGLFVSLVASPGAAVLTSRLSGNVAAGAQQFDPRIAYQWRFHRAGQSGQFAQTLTPTLAGPPPGVENLGYEPPVAFCRNRGKFYFGGDGSAVSFAGSLDEVMFDPDSAGGIRAGEYTNAVYLPSLSR